MNITRIEGYIGQAGYFTFGRGEEQVIIVAGTVDSLERAHDLMRQGEGKKDVLDKTIIRHVVILAREHVIPAQEH
jgi:hypothetical protein